MFSIKDFAKNSAQHSKRIQPGEYLAEVAAVTDNKKYVHGTAFIVKYHITQADGSCIDEFEETFFNDLKNPRTLELVDLMKKLGIDDADQLVGKTIRVEIKYRITSYGKSLPSIVARNPVVVPVDEMTEEVQ